MQSAENLKTETNILLLNDEQEMFDKLFSVEPYKESDQKIISHEEEFVHPDNILDDLRNTFISFARTGNETDWRWSPVPIKDWLLGKHYLNLGKTIRKSVHDDIVDFFYTEGMNPWEKRYDVAVFCEGIGCHAKGTKVIKYNGSLVNVEDICLGDKLMGDDSTIRNVVRVIHGKEMMYRVVPIKGEPFIVNENHILSLKRTNKGIINKHRKHGGKSDRKAGQIVNISVKDYLQKSDKFKKLHKLWRTGAEFEHKLINIDPYFLGLWLGDGCNHIIGITTKDEEIKDYIYQYAKATDLFVTVNQNKNKTCPTYIINGKRLKDNYLMSCFRSYDLIKNKHIPFKYKTNDNETRLQLLAGLIDSDGHLSKSNMEFSNKNKRLCEDVLFLCRSLGLAAYMSERETTCEGKSFKSYRISISGDLSIIPTKLKRKQAESRKQKKNVLVTGFRIEELGEDNFYGFELDGNHLYLTEDFTVHHNSGKSFKTSIIATYFQHLLLCLRCPQTYFGIDKSSKIAIMNMSISEQNAKKVIFSEVMNKISECAWFTERGWDREDARVPDPHCRSELRFKNNTYIIPGSSSWRSSVGYNLLVGIIDEAGSYRSTDNGDQCEEIFNTMERRLGSRFAEKGAIIMAGSPMFEQDFVEMKIRESETHIDSRILARRRPLWVSKYPDWNGDYFYVHKKNKVIVDEVPEDLTDIDKIPAIPFLFKAFRANVTKAYRDFGGQPSATICPFFERPSIVYERVNKERIEDPVDIYGKIKDTLVCQDPYAFHAIHIDLGITGDACGFALGHFNGLTEEGGIKVYIDLMMRIQGSKKNPVQISSIRELIYQLEEMGFPISKITFDGFQSTDSIQILEKKGYEAGYLSVDRTTLPYNNLKSAINEDRLDYYLVKNTSTEEPSASEVFVKEVSQLEDIEGKKVDHPPKGTKDVADAVCGVTHHIIENADEYGVITAKAI